MMDAYSFLPGRAWQPVEIISMNDRVDVPDIVRELAHQNIAVYQIVRYAKTINVRT